MYILTTMIQVKNIAKAYGKQNILTDVSFSAEPGERVAIVGRNGCGKSTLLQILSGIMKPDAGELQYYNRFPLQDSKAFRELCGYVPQANPLLEELSVRDNLKLFGASSDIVKDPLLAGFELESIMNKPVGKLSGGMKRRVAIACAIHHIPSVLFMDEPTTALDIYYKQSIHDWMDYYRTNGGILIVATHDEAEIQACDQCIFIENGRSSEKINANE